MHGSDRKATPNAEPTLGPSATDSQRAAGQGDAKAHYCKTHRAPDGRPQAFSELILELVLHLEFILEISSLQISASCPEASRTSGEVTQQLAA